MTSNPHRPRPLVAAVAASLLLLGGLAGGASAQRPPATRLLPDTTVVLLSIADVPDMVQRFQRTSTGRMSQDPQLKPLLNNLYGSLTAAAARLQEQVGLSLPELLAIPQGEVAVAVIAREEVQPAMVLLIDTGNQIGNARKLLERVTVRMEESGSRRAEQTVAGTKLIIYEGGGVGRRMIYFEKDTTIVVGTDPEVLKQILAVWNGAKGNTIADNPNFTAIMRRCHEAGDEEPQLTLYVDPIGIMRAIGQENTSVRVAVAVLPALGLDGLTAAGASVTWDAGQFDSVMHAHVLLDAPRSGVIKMVALEPGDSKPERWVPADVASYTTFHWNVERTYRELVPLYDSFNGEGAFAQFLQRRFLQPTGIDLEKELLPSLEGRVTHITWFERPVTPQSRASMLAIKLKDTQVFDKAVDKLMSLTEGRIARQTWAGKTYYEVQTGRPDNLPPEQGVPRPCFGLLDDYLLVTDRDSLYKKMISTQAGGSELLVSDPEFKLIASKITRQSGGQRAALISFNRPEEAVRWLYDLAGSQQTRQRLGQQAENNPFFRALDKALRENPLPPFAVIRRYLAPGGGMVVDEPTGLHYMAFGLRRK